MKKLNPPAVNDAQALCDLAMDSGVGSYPQLQPAVGLITAGYSQYISVRGNPFLVDSIPLANVQREYLKGHYEKPPKVIQHIRGHRNVTGALVCSMCGSTHSGTLDHVLPQSTDPEFSIFSRNLVPACKCNSNRGNLTFGVRPGERLLHPYFDKCLSLRLVVARFEKINDLLPKVSLKMTMGVPSVDRYAVKFHIQEILEKTHLKGHLFNKWANLCRKPSLEVRGLKQQFTSKNQVKQVLIDELDALDDKFGTKNSWDSIFVTALLDPPTLQWLFDRLTAPGRILDDPLL